MPASRTRRARRTARTITDTDDIATIARHAIKLMAEEKPKTEPLTDDQIRSIPPELILTNSSEANAFKHAHPGRKCLVVDKDRKAYWTGRTFRCEKTLSRVYAIVVTVEDAWDWAQLDVVNYEVAPLVMPPPPPPPDPNKPKCDIRDVLSNQVIELLSTAPNNTLVRAMVLNAIKRALPDEAKTFDEIKHWIEWNIEKPAFLFRPHSSPEAAQRNLIAFRIEVTANETQHGTAQYTVNAAGSTDFGITEAELMEWASEAETLDDLMDAIDQDIRSNAEIETDTDDDTYSYEDHQYGDTSNLEYEYSNTTLHANVVEALRRIAPDAAQRLLPRDVPF